LADPAAPAADFTISSEPTERQRKARTWFGDRLHFDVLASDEWLGGIALLAPNPLVRTFQTTLSRSPTNNSEIVRVFAPPRQGASTGSLSIRFHEERFGAPTAVQQLPLDAYGRAEIHLPEPVREVVAELQCSRRGLLAISPPHGFVRGVGINFDIVSTRVNIEVPSPKPGRPSTTYEKEVRASETLTVGSSLTPEPVRRLIELKERASRRTGEARPDAHRSGDDVEQALFYDNREEAAAFVHRLISKARRIVLFVDPFFDHVALREFALAASYPEVVVRVLLGREDHLKTVIPDAGCPLGDVLLAELDEITRRSSELGLSVPDLRLMGANARKYHDRFLVLDEEVWHCGHSFNQIGRGEVSVMTLLRHPDQLRGGILADLDAGDPYADYWRSVIAQRVTSVPFWAQPFMPLLTWWTALARVWAGILSRQQNTPTTSTTNPEDGLR
jgi:hypothetical protein